MHNTRVGIYARVSTSEQAEEGYSIDAQLSTVRTVCEGMGKKIIDEYVDRGISGKSMTNRPALQRLLDDVRDKKIDEVVVWKTNRLARNHLDLLKMVEVFEMNEVDFRSITEPFDTSTPVGKLLMNMLASIGEFERGTIVDNVKLGMKQRARKGKWNGGRLLGYKSIKLKALNGNDTRLKIIEEEAEIVKKIFQLYSEGKGLKATANAINKMGYKTIKGNYFGVTAISDIIRNPTYIGKIRFNRHVDWSTKKRKGKSEDYILVEGEHDPIIDKDLWDKVQEIIKRRSHKPRRTFDGTFPLTGLLKCPECGSSMVAARTTNKLVDGTKRVIRYYYCGTFKNKGSEACSSNSIRADYAEEYVFDRIKEVVLNDKMLKDIVKNLNKSRRKNIKPLEKELDIINNNLKKLSNKKNKVFELYEESIIDKSTLSERLTSVDEEVELKIRRKKQIEEKLNQNTSEEIPFEVVQKVMKDFHNLLQKASKDNQKMLLQMLIDKITIKNRKKIDTIEIQFNKEIQKSMFQDEEESSNSEGSSSFVFKIAI